MAGETKLDLYIVPPKSDAQRRELAEALNEIYPLEGARRSTFLRGERVLLRSALTADQVQRVADNVQSIGVRIELEPHLPDGGDDRPQVADIDAFSNPQDPPSHNQPGEGLGSMFDLSAGLVGLDGEADDAGPAHAPSAAPSPLGSGSMLGGLALADLDEPVGPVAKRPPASPPSTKPPIPPLGARGAAPPRPGPPVPVPAAPIDRFRPSGHDSSALEIAIDRPPPDPMRSQPPPPEKDSFEVPRCPTHGDLKSGGRCPTCAAEEAAIRGRLFGGRLRDRPQLRVGVGVIAGLLLGWVVTTPMARRAERQVEYVREEAHRERLRPLEAAQAHAAELETKADEDAQSAFLRTVGLWALITAGVAATWMRLT